MVFAHVPPPEEDDAEILLTSQTSKASEGRECPVEALYLQEQKKPFHQSFLRKICTVS